LSNLTTAGQQLASGQFGQAGFDAVTDAQNIADLGAVPDTAISPSDTVSQATDFGAGQGPETLDFTGQKIEYPGAQNFSQVQEPGFVDTFKDYGSKASDLLFGKAATPADVAAAQGEAYKTAFDAALPTGGQAAAEAAGLKAMEGVTASSVGPGFMRKVLPSVALAGGATYLAGGFDAPEVEEADLGPTGADMLRLTPYEYLIGQQNLRARGSQGRTVVPTAYAAEGGEIFPRRVGGIMPNEGTPGKDSVRAMLMPGEFVMTTDAVKGLGNGDNDKGISNMYQMMRGLEAKGRAMALWLPKTQS